LVLSVGRKSFLNWLDDLDLVGQPGDIVKLKFDKREDLVTAMESINAANKIARSISVLFFAFKLFHSVL